jgi:hypothetical protein
MIDTLNMYQKLEEAGLKSKQAEAITRAIAVTFAARTTDLVTKKDLEVWAGFGSNDLETARGESIGSINQSIRKIEDTLQKSIKNSARTVIQWIVGSHLATLIGLVALAKAGAVF